MDKEVVVKEKKQEGQITVSCPTSSCDSCKSKMFCNVKTVDFDISLPKDFDSSKISEGDMVTIELPYKATVLSLLLVFVLPLFFMFAFLLVSYFSGFEQKYQALFTVLGLILGLALSYILNKFVVKNRLNPVLKTSK